MKPEAIKTIEKGKLAAKLFADESPESPREWDNLGTMVCWHRRYNLGDEQPKESFSDWRRTLAGGLVSANDVELISDEHISRILEKHAVMIPIGLYDHSGITMYAGGGASIFDLQGWDSGTVGVIYTTRSKIVEEYGEYTEETRIKARECLEQEIKTYDQYLTGDVYGYVIEDAEGNHVDSCWGFYGLEYAEQEATDALDGAIKYEAKQIELIDNIMHL